MNRRKLLQLFDWGAVTIATSPAASGLDDEKQECPAQAIVAPSRVDIRVIAHLATILRYCKQQDDVLGPCLDPVPCCIPCSPSGSSPGIS